MSRTPWRNSSATDEPVLPQQSYSPPGGGENHRRPHRGRTLRVVFLEDGRHYRPGVRPAERSGGSAPQSLPRPALPAGGRLRQRRPLLRHHAARPGEPGRDRGSRVLWQPRQLRPDHHLGGKRQRVHRPRLRPRSTSRKHAAGNAEEIDLSGEWESVCQESSAEPSAPPFRSRGSRRPCRHRRRLAGQRRGAARGGALLPGSADLG